MGVRKKQNEPSFKITSLFKHEQQQVSVAKEGEAAISLEGYIGLCYVAAGRRKVLRELYGPPNALLLMELTGR